MCQVVGAGCSEERLGGHVFPGVAERRNETFPVFIFDLGVFEGCKKKLVTFVVLVTAVFILLGHGSGDESLEFSDVFVDCVCC